MNNPALQIVQKRPSHVYHVGEAPEFHFQNVPQGTTVTFSCDGEAVLDRRTLNGDAAIPFGLPLPGVLRCTAQTPDGRTVLAGAAFDPEQIRPVLPEPDDFDAFWHDRFQHLAAVPVDFQMTPRPQETPDADYYDLSCAGLNGSRTYGFLKIPRAAGPLPLLLYVDAAGCGIEFERFHDHCARAEHFLRQPAILANVTVHNYRPADRAEEHQRQHEAYCRSLNVTNYWFEGLAGDDPEKTFFVRAITGAKRMCDCLAALPQVDPAKIVYLGVSQGGAMGVYLTALCDYVKAAFCGVPALGDCGGFLLGRHTPQSGYAEYRTHYRKMRYFDTANFARRITVPVLMTNGLLDVTCTPSSVWAIWHELQGTKLFYSKPDHGHDGGPEGYEALSWNFAASHLFPR